jgi:TPR repeat protein
MIDAELLLRRGHAAEEAGDYETARACFRKAADLGDEVGLNRLANMLDLGLGAHPDKVEAMRLYREAWRRRSAVAAANIAVLYRERGNRRRAHEWLVRAAKAGDGDACLEVAKNLIAGTGVRKSLEMAVRWLQAARNQSNVTQHAVEEASALLQTLTLRLQPSR